MLDLQLFHFQEISFLREFQLKLDSRAEDALSLSSPPPVRAALRRVLAMDPEARFAASSSAAFFAAASSSAFFLASSSPIVELLEVEANLSSEERLAGLLREIANGSGSVHGNALIDS